MDKYKTIVVEKRGDIAYLGLNRPKVLNALGKQMLLDLKKVIAQIEKDKKIRFVVVYGEGKAFSAGGDIKQVVKATPKEMQTRSLLAEEVTIAMEKSRKIYVAQIHSYCLGGGLELALACDYRIASTNAVFGLPEGKLGIIPGFGATVRLPAVIGSSQAKKLLLTGLFIKAKEAYFMGLVHECVSIAQLKKAVTSFLSTARKHAPSSLATIKQVFSKTIDKDTKKGLAIERKLFSQLFGKKEQKEGMSAFLEKRCPRW